MEEVNAKLSAEPRAKQDGLHTQLQRGRRMTRDYVQQEQDTKGRKE